MARSAALAQEATQRQAEQNQEMMRLNRDVADSHKRLVENEGKARQETVALQQELVQRDAQGRQDLNQLQREAQTAAHEEGTRLDQGRDQVEEARRRIAENEYRDPIVAESIRGVGILLACLLPLVLAIYLLRAVGRHDPTEAELAELLTQELVSDQPMLLPPYAATPPSLGTDPTSRPALPSEDKPDCPKDDARPEDHRPACNNAIAITSDALISPSRRC